MLGSRGISAWTGAVAITVVSGTLRTMAFPETRLTMLHRIAASDDETAWRQFLSDYWRPICLFAVRIGSLRWEDAEDVASQTVEVIQQKDLLKRWLADPRSRFKTLICGVVRNLVSNRVRSERTDAKLLKDYAAESVETLSQTASSEDLKAFYGIWAEELLRTAVQATMWSYHRAGRGDYFRVLYGRICDGLGNQEIANLLGIKVTDAENYFRHARQKLTEQLQAGIRREVERDAIGDSLEADFRHEWDQLAVYFDAHGGLEESIRRASVETQ